MVHVKEVPADLFIEELAKYLEENVKTVKPPAWSAFAKTGSIKEKVPESSNWWYVRAASILRKLYISDEPIGVGSFRNIYGGLKKRGSAPPHFRRSGSSIVRHMLHQLEVAGLVTKVEKRGRILSPKGRSILDNIANKVFEKLVAVRPEMSKYG
ncbi:MAG: 30S ribosomal protein S19e [Zestosphaera sp.]